MLLLAIDTSTSAISVALHDGTDVLTEASTLDARAHAEFLAPNIRTVLAEAEAAASDVTEVVVGTGPGPFTGVRVGIVTAHTFAFALGLPVHGVCSLDALAHDHWLRADAPAGELLVATDARRKEVYAARYVLGEGGAARVAEPVVSRAADLDEALRSLPTAGRGPLLYPDALPHGVEPLDVSAAALADLAARRLRAGEALDGLEPMYLRRPDAAPTPPSQKSTLG